jgi:hypothetical protein
MASAATTDLRHFIILIAHSIEQLRSWAEDLRGAGEILSLLATEWYRPTDFDIDS